MLSLHIMLAIVFIATDIDIESLLDEEKPEADDDFDIDPDENKAADEDWGEFDTNDDPLADAADDDTNKPGWITPRPPGGL